MMEGTAVSPKCLKAQKTPRVTVQIGEQTIPPHRDSTPAAKSMIRSQSLSDDDGPPCSKLQTKLGEFLAQASCEFVL